MLPFKKLFGNGGGGGGGIEELFCATVGVSLVGGGGG